MANLTASLPGLIGETPRKRIAGLGRRGERVRKPLADDEIKRLVGRAIERAIELAGTTKQVLSGEMGYTDQSALSRWISGAETPQLAMLFSVPTFRAPFVLALAELAHEDVDVQTVITIRRTG